MAQKTPWIYAAILALCSYSAHGASLGKLTVTSALGQPLRAEIELVETQANEVDSLTARLASTEAFQQAGIERNGTLLKVRFNIERKKKGKVVLKLSTAQPVNEPFLDMLVELNWTAGRLLREYTVLLDPPGYVEPRAIEPVAVPTNTSVADAPAPQPAPASLPVVQPDTAGNVEKEAVTTSAPPATSPSSGEAKHYSVKKGDTLTSIASELKPQGLSLEQMLAALYQANKQAFAGHNMNRLKSGQILRVPEESEVAANGRAEAAQEVKTHTADWNAYRQKLAATVSATAAPKEDTPRQTAQGKISPAVQEQGTAPSPSQDVLKVTKGEAAGTARETQALQSKLASLQEETTAKAKAIKEAGERIATLEKSVNDMQQLIELKNKNMAELQNNEGAAVKSATAATVTPPEEPPVTTPPAKIAEKQVSPAPQLPTQLPSQEESGRKTLYFAGGIVALFALGGGAVFLINRRRSQSIYADQSLTSLYHTTTKQ